MANRIKQLRQEQRMTQVRLSIELEVSQETISSYEQGKYYPSYQTLVKLSDILHTSIDYMMGRSDVRFPQQTNLSEREEQALALFSALSEARQDVAIAYMQGLADSPGEGVATAKSPNKQGNPSVFGMDKRR